jgi:hypothetical protein
MNIPPRKVARFAKTIVMIVNEIISRSIKQPNPAAANIFPSAHHPIPWKFLHILD